MDSIRPTGIQNITHDMPKTKAVKETAPEISTADSFVKSSKPDNLSNIKNTGTGKSKRKNRIFAENMTIRDWAEAAVFFAVPAVIGALAGAGVGAGLALITGGKIAQTAAIMGGVGAVGLPAAAPYLLGKMLSVK